MLVNFVEINENFDHSTSIMTLCNAIISEESLTNTQQNHRLEEVQRETAKQN